MCVNNNRTQLRDHQPNNRTEGESRPALSVWMDNPNIYGYKADGPVICMLREIYQPDIDLVIVLGQTETLCEDGTEIRTVGKARPWVLELIPSLVDRRPNNSGIRI